MIIDDKLKNVQVVVDGRGGDVAVRPIAQHSNRSVEARDDANCCEENLVEVRLVRHGIIYRRYLCIM